ncbi:hypothetical protein GGTG_11541 [Gaeumannomyces tritici R3-111a-1]|uniref:Uncharacterized protein n=1 Tax=Gaeumannomyces tritici (strain R3-111a-1) TaxID=644352 RepID=J3PDH0_GAET3|nr:hypothetical protein GGTG_11541 [Gaeumannomyces tritici R3-111a-1]EJT70518.1 hypothetical protein GGTG_11541 [Gaeumannomyces tritici R3-111a-1]
MPASYRYRGQSIMAKLKDRVKLKLHESAWNAKNLKDRPRVPEKAIKSTGETARQKAGSVKCTGETARQKKKKGALVTNRARTFRGYAGKLSRLEREKFKKPTLDAQKGLKQTRPLNPKNPKQKVLRKAKLLLNLLCLKNWQFGKISPITLIITNLFLKAKKNVTRLKSLRGIPLLNKRITNRSKRFKFVGI